MSGKYLLDTNMVIALFAAIAVQHNLMLVSRDGHFSEIENLKVIAW